MSFTISVGPASTCAGRRRLARPDGLSAERRLAPAVRIARQPRPGGDYLLPGIPLDGWPCRRSFRRIVLHGTRSAARGRLIALGFAVGGVQPADRRTPTSHRQRGRPRSPSHWVSAADAATPAARCVDGDMRRVIQPAIAASWRSPLDDALTYVDLQTGRSFRRRPRRHGALHDCSTGGLRRGRTCTEVNEHIRPLGSGSARPRTSRRPTCSNTSHGRHALPRPRRRRSCPIDLPEFSTTRPLIRGPRDQSGDDEHVSNPTGARCIWITAPRDKV